MTLIIVFNSTNQALSAERALEEKGVDIDIVPLPPGLSAECGLAIEFSRELEDFVGAALLERGIKFKGMYDPDGRPVKPRR